MRCALTHGGFEDGYVRCIERCGCVGWEEQEQVQSWDGQDRRIEERCRVPRTLDGVRWE